ncbi:xylulokinase [Virgisporangium ochraceum]|uniref:Xylulose kinase n=1 Tax=Virgisporangium ochraceum TaxID=65505 RepID=A0A8J3ZZ67_9ACTN|nr:FGGY-family carbohydrate kinase [Virgisporangium ochraceum]GIJ71572.1 xylulokinase [Virgisporangium ochraceum]
MPLVAGVDSSTQSCKVVVRDADTGTLVREGRVPHPAGTAVPPAAWEAALSEAVERAGGLDDVAAASVAGQMQGMVCLDADGTVVRDAVLWNDTRSAGAARDLISELGGGDAGRRAWADAVGLVPVASFTVTKLRWLASAEPDNAARTEAVCLPHDWLTWRLAGAPGLASLRTDRSEASGTGYWSAAAGDYRRDLVGLALGRDDVLLPEVLGPTGRAGQLRNGAPLGPGGGDCAAAALGAGAGPGDVVVSIGTSGIVTTVADAPAVDPTGTVAGYADMTGRFLPLVCTLNAARVLDAAATMLRVDHAELSVLALSGPPGADGLVLVPYLEGERTPDRPHATGSVHGLTLRTSTPAHVARAAVEGMLCALADGLDAMTARGTTVNRIILVGGGARSEAVRRIAPTVFGRPVLVPPLGEHVADGAARQAAWVLSGGPQPPAWTAGQVETHEADAVPAIRERYAAARNHILEP